MVPDLSSTCHVCNRPFGKFPNMANEVLCVECWCSFCYAYVGHKRTVNGELWLMLYNQGLHALADKVIADWISSKKESANGVS